MSSFKAVLSGIRCAWSKNKNPCQLTIYFYAGIKSKIMNAKVIIIIISVLAVLKLNLAAAQESPQKFTLQCNS
jgi:hypothetical protein